MTVYQLFAQGRAVPPPHRACGCRRRTPHGRGRRVLDAPALHAPRAEDATPLLARGAAWTCRAGAWWSRMGKRQRVSERSLGASSLKMKEFLKFSRLSKLLAVGTDIFVAPRRVQWPGTAPRSGSQINQSILYNSHQPTQFI